MLNSVFSWRNFSFASPVRLAPLLTKLSYVFAAVGRLHLSVATGFLLVYSFYAGKQFSFKLMLLLCSDSKGIIFLPIPASRH